jgi:hypothetical protein
LKSASVNFLKNFARTAEVNPYLLIPPIPMVPLMVVEPSIALWLIGFAVVYGVLL